MALLSNMTRNVSSLISSTSKLRSVVAGKGRPTKISGANRYASTNTSESNSQKGNSSSDQHESGGWLNRVLSPSHSGGSEPHSRVLSAPEFIYEMCYHDAIPSMSDDYIKKYEVYSKEVGKKTNNKAELVASFRVEVGDQDQFIHIWRYESYRQASTMHKILKTDETLVKMNKDQAKDLRKRESQFMSSFSFWGHPEPQIHNSYYEMRSYVLKPGTTIEWANGWSKGIKHRVNGVGGFFSQVGQMYVVHHIWRYGDLQVRKDVRENAWARPGWDDCVKITVPTIVCLTSRWMTPNSFSPIR